MKKRFLNALLSDLTENDRRGSAAIINEVYGWKVNSDFTKN